MSGASPVVAVIGGGPAGLMAAQTIAEAGIPVAIHDAMPGVGRKFLVAGRGGLNLTHSEPLERFVERYGAATGRFAALLEDFPPAALRAWAENLGIETFVGSSGRVFPRGLRAAPLLRAWLGRLRELGVTIHPRQRWIGFADDGALRIATATGELHIAAPATVLALGGASWPRTGSDGAWTTLLEGIGVRVRPLRPANCGFLVAWPEAFHARFAGTPLKTLAISGGGSTVRGELMITGYGLEGGALYALGAGLRDEIDARGNASLTVDFKPDLDHAAIADRLTRRGKRSLAAALRETLKLPAAACALILDRCTGNARTDVATMAAAVKATALALTGLRPIAEAISSAGGIAFDELDDGLMLRRRPGFFACGEMLDWEAPTGGYLLQGCFSSGRRAGAAAARWLGR